MLRLTVHGLTDEQADNIMEAIFQIGTQEIRDRYAWVRARTTDGIDLTGTNLVTASAIASVLLDEDSGADYLI